MRHCTTCPPTSSATVALNLANLVSARAKLKTVIVSFDTPLSLARLIEISGDKSNDDAFYEIPEFGLSLFDASRAKGLDLEALFKKKGYQAIVWDLPPAEDMVWHALRLPFMPLVGVAEYETNTYFEMTESATWLNLLSSRRGVPTGLYLAKSSNPKWLRVSEESEQSRAS